MSDLTIPSVQEAYARQRKAAHDDLVAAIRYQISGLAPTLVAELVGKAVGEIVGEEIEALPLNVRSMVSHMSQHRLAKGFNDSLRATRKG